MDQVIFYLKDSLGFFQREPEGSLLTSSMINNYVKNGVLPHPDKKKYGKEHLAALTVLCLLKPVLSIPDIGELLRGQDIQGVYGAFWRPTPPRCERPAASWRRTGPPGRTPRSWP